MLNNSILNILEERVIGYVLTAKILISLLGKNVIDVKLKLKRKIKLLLFILFTTIITINKIQGKKKKK
jgi:hypothetical protein